MSDHSRTFWIAVTSHRFVFGSYESHTDTHNTSHNVFPFEAVIGRHHLFAVDVWGTLRKLNNRQDMAGQTSCYRGSNKKWLVRHRVTGTVTQTWLVRHLVTGTVTQTWLVKHLVTGTVTQTWLVKHLVTGTVTQTWLVRHLVTGTVTQTWLVRHRVTGTVTRNGWSNILLQGQ